MVRPCRLDTVQFRRPITDEQRSILLVAGQGDISEGFQRVLAVYRHVHGLGFQYGDPLESISLVTNDSHLGLEEEIG